MKKKLVKLKVNCQKNIVERVKRILSKDYKDEQHNNLKEIK